MSAFTLTDAGTQINAGNLESEASIEERKALRAGIPLPILLNSVARFLRKAETETAVFIQSLPNIDLEKLDPNQRNCAICWDVFKLQSKSIKLSSLSERDSTPLQLPCAHIICKACIQGWLAKTGTCPFCRHQCTRREFLGNDAASQRDIRRRESYKEFAELAPHYLATINPQINTYGEFTAWAFIDHSEILSLRILSLRILRMRAQLVIGNFNRFPTTLEERMLQGPDGRRLLMKLRAALAAGLPLKVIDYSEHEEQSDEEGDFEGLAYAGDVLEEYGNYSEDEAQSDEEGDFEGLAYADDVLEEYGSTDEEEEPADDDDYGGEFLDESEDAATSITAAEREEDEEHPANDHNGWQITDESEDAAASTAAAAVATMLEGVVKDLVNEDKDDDGDVASGATEIEEEKKSRSVSLLGCAALISMAGLAILMTSRICTNTC